MNEYFTLSEFAFASVSKNLKNSETILSGIRKWILLLLLFAIVLSACKDKSGPGEEIPDVDTSGYHTQGSALMKKNCEWEFRGTDKMSIWDWNYDSVAAWGMDITRECIDMKLTTNEELLHIVQLARAKGFVTILTAVWWDSDAINGGTTPYPACQLLGSIPSTDPRFLSVQERWQAIAALFKNQTDVWFGVWNEPYNWKKEQTASSQQWLSDASLMVDNIRSTGANNIIVLCGNAMGQGYEPFLEKGPELLQGRKNIVFDIHAYQTYWDLNQTAIENILTELKNADIAPVIIGEFSANGTQPYQSVMNACRTTNTSILAWLWNQYEEPFKSTFRSYCGERRNLNCGTN
jgi:mannan endo-1,4-beta-mannosidase